MINHHRKKVENKSHYHGKGLLNRIINKLRFELHLPGYRYCGPGTKLVKRLARGDPGVHLLDTACKEHDISYSKNRQNIEVRNSADRFLADKAWQRVFSKVASIGEKVAAVAISNVMNVESKLGMGLKKNRKTISKTKMRKNIKKRVALRKIVDAAKKFIIPSNDPKDVIQAVAEGARIAVKKAGSKRQVSAPRILPIPYKFGGVLPLIPIFAGLSALGALSGGVAGVVKAVNDANAAKRHLE